MSLDKLVDSTQLDADLASVANAIRAKSGGSSQLAFPAGFVSAIGDIPAQETVYYTANNGTPYFKNTVIPNASYTAAPNFYKATNMVSCVINKSNSGASSNNMFRDCTKLESVVINSSMTFTNNNNEFWNCTKLKTAQLGGIGRPISNLSHSNVFRACTQTGLTITIYVNASSLSSLPSGITGSPWGATNATIIYRNSTTGEVLT